ncbi:MAG: hypothetical protein R6V76_02600, partial [Desulfobacterales bacterium]
MSGVILPVFLTLVVQALVSMSAVAIPVLMPVAAGELNIPSSYVGFFMSLIYLGATGHLSSVRPPGDHAWPRGPRLTV